MGEGTVLTHVPPAINSPFASAQAVEHPILRAFDVGAPADPPEGVAFLDGIQRYSVVGRLGVVPVVRGYVAAAVLGRRDGTLHTLGYRKEEFVVAPLDRLPDRAVRELESVGLPLVNSAAGDRPHPILDIQLAGRCVEARREDLELRLARICLSEQPDRWLVMDGPITGLRSLRNTPRVLGLIKSHETQFFAGDELETALMLPAAYRTSVFSREFGQRHRVYAWYLRLWPWAGHDLLYGLIRLERAPIEQTLAEATAVSRWLLAERAPLSAPDGRWDRLIYPIHQVEAYLRAQLGEWL